MNEIQSDDLTTMEEFGMRKITDIEGRIDGYITSTKTGEKQVIIPRSLSIVKNKKEEKIQEVLDLSDDLIDADDNLSLKGNLLDSLNTLLNDFWEMRQEREREFAKLIVLIQTITKGYNLEISNDLQIKALTKTLQVLKKPRITELDIKDSKNILTDADFDIYKPMIKKPSLKITIQEE